MSKHVTIHDPWDPLNVDMSREDVSELMIHQHFTNIQHSLRLTFPSFSAAGSRKSRHSQSANRFNHRLASGSSFRRQSVVHAFSAPLTEAATRREGALCARDGITINTFLVPNWSQSEEGIRFARRLSEQTKGRIFFTAGGDLDRLVVWDYLNRKREILG